MCLRESSPRQYSSDKDLKLCNVRLHGRLLTDQLLDEVVFLLKFGLECFSLSLVQGYVVSYGEGRRWERGGGGEKGVGGMGVEENINPHM